MNKEDEKKLYVEFVGLPGSGKTTIIRELTKMLEGEGYKVAGRMDFYGMSEFKRHFYPVLCALTSIKIIKGLVELSYWLIKLRLFNVTKKTFFLVMKFYTTKKFIIRLQKKIDFFLWEGEYHLLPNLAINKVDEKRLREFLEFFVKGQSTVIVYVKSPLKVIQDRLVERGSNSFRELKRYRWEVQHDVHKEREERQENMINILKNMDNIFVLEIDGTKAPQQNAKYIFRAIGG